MKQRILIFADHFLPGFLAGGPILSLSLLYQNLSDRFEPTIVTRNRDFGMREPYADVAWDRLTRYREFSVCYLSRIDLGVIRSLIREVCPGAIYLNSFFSGFSRRVLLLHRLGLLPCRVILAPRGELSSEALAIKGAKKAVYLRLFRLLRLEKGVVFHATDAAEEVAIRGLFRTDVRLLPNFSRPVGDVAGPLPGKDAGSLRLVFLSRITEKKNLREALGILACRPIRGEVDFHVYGPVEDGEYWDVCLARSRELPPNVRFRYQGPVDSEEVLATLSRHHVLFLPTRNENFGHAIVEAMKLGVLPIISDRTPWRGLAAAGAGWDLPLGDERAFAEAIQEAVNLDAEAFALRSARCRAYIARAADESGKREGYHRLFKELSGAAACERVPVAAGIT